MSSPPASDPVSPPSEGTEERAGERGGEHVGERAPWWLPIADRWRARSGTREPVGGAHRRRTQPRRIALGVLAGIAALLVLLTLDAVWAGRSMMRGLAARGRRSPRARWPR